jgi:hypothetical protein
MDHDLGSGYAARLSYIGSETHQLVWAPDENTLPFSTTVRPSTTHLNRAVPQLGPHQHPRYRIQQQLPLSCRLKRATACNSGLEYQSGLTWAKNLADNQGPSNTGLRGEGGGARATSILNRHADFGNVGGTRRLRWNYNCSLRPSHRPRQNASAPHAKSS